MRVLAIIVSWLWFVGFPQQAYSSTSQVVPPFKVGVVVPLSGQYASFGVAVKNGIELAIANNSKSLNGISFIFADSSDNLSTAAQAFNQMVEVDKVNLILTWGEKNSRKLAQLASKIKFPLVTLSIERSIAAGRETVVRFYGDADRYAVTIVNHLVAHKYKNIVIIKDDSIYFERILQGLESNLPEGTNIDLILNVSPGAESFKMELSRLFTKGPEVVGVFLAPGRLAKFYQEMNTAGMRFPTFGTEYFADLKELKNSGDGINGAVFPEFSVSDEFRNAYSRRYRGLSKLATAGLAYDFALHIATVFPVTTRQARGLDVIRLFTKLEQRQGVTGKYVFEESMKGGKAFQIPFVLKQISNFGIEIASRTQKISTSNLVKPNSANAEQISRDAEKERSQWINDRCSKIMDDPQCEFHLKKKLKTAERILIQADKQGLTPQEYCEQYKEDKGCATMLNKEEQQYLRRHIQEIRKYCRENPDAPRCQNYFSASEFPQKPKFEAEPDEEDENETDSNELLEPMYPPSSVDSEESFGLDSVE